MTVNATLYRLSVRLRTRRGAVATGATLTLVVCALVVLVPSDNGARAKNDNEDVVSGDRSRRANRGGDGRGTTGGNDMANIGGGRSDAVTAAADGSRRAEPLHSRTRNDPTTTPAADDGSADHTPVGGGSHAWGHGPLGSATPEEQRAVQDAIELNRLHGPPVVPSPVTWAESHGVWMSVDGGWMHGFIADDGRFFTTYRGNAPQTNGPPPAGARTISNVGEDRLFLVHSKAYYAQDGDVLTPGLSVGGGGGNVHTFLVFEGSETISYMRLAQVPFGPMRWRYLFFELTDEIEVVTIYRQ